MKTHVLTVADRPGGNFDALRKSCEIFEIPLKVLGWNEPFKGLMSKLKLIDRAMNAMAESDVVLFVDAFDVIFAFNLETIQYRFEKMGKLVLFSAERNCAPSRQLIPRYPKRKSPYRYLNSGAWIAQVSAMRRIFEEMQIHEIPDSINDQYVFSEYYVKDPSVITLDEDCVCFQSLFSSELDLDYWPQPKNRFTGSEPCILHGNGHADMSKSLAWLDSKSSNHSFRLSRQRDNGLWNVPFTIDLLASIDSRRDAINGIWTIENCELRGYPSSCSCIQTQEVVASEYELIVEFTRTKGKDAIGIIFTVNGVQFTALLGGWNANILRFSAACSDEFPIIFENGVRHTCLIRVRQKEVVVCLDGNKICSQKYLNMPISNLFRLRSRQHIGFGADRSEVAIHRFEIKSLGETDDGII